MPNRRQPALIFLLICCLTGPVSAGPFSALYVLGDSQSDSGNSGLLTTERAVPPYQPVPDAPYPNGRLTNGPVWAETLAARLGKTAAPSLAGGTNYAVATARITGGDEPAISLEAQAAGLLIDVGGALPPTALFAVWGGANDIFDALSVGPSRITTAITALDGILRGLAAAGARHFLVPNLGDSGLAPIFAADPIFGTAMTLNAQQFNTELDAMLTALMTDLPAIDLITLDVFALSQALASDPASFGLANVTAPCLIFGTIPPDPTQCTNPDQYAFWDALHFTTAVHRTLGNAAYDTVPLPAPFALLAPGLLLLRWRRPA